MAKRINKATKATTQKPIEQYEHKDKQRVNNPPVGLVDAHTDNGGYKKKTYQYDPHLDPQLQWAGKAEHTSFDVPTVSLHVHERIDPRRIIENIKKQDDNSQQTSLFEEQKKPLREAIEFYKHKENWSNRLIAGDSLLVMNSLLEKESMGSKVQMMFFDPPYGISYKSNFQAFVNKKVVKDRDEDLTSEPETLKAFRDSWELGIHSYLTYIRDRMLLTRELLHDSGCVIVQINVENQHYLAAILNEVFGPENMVSNIVFRKKGIPLGSKHIEIMHDHLLVYAKNKEALKYRHIYEEADVSLISSHGPYALFPDKTWKSIPISEYKHSTHAKGTKYYRLYTLNAPSYSKETDFKYEFEGRVYDPPSGGCWIVQKDKLDVLRDNNRLQREGNSLSYRFFIDDFPYKKLTAFWDSIGTSYQKIYAVQTAPKVLERLISMFTDPGDIVMDITCGSGTTAYASEKLGRRWITCDTSRVALTLAKKRLMTSVFDYFKLRYPLEGVGSGFEYQTAPKITMRSVANRESFSTEEFFDQPKVDISKTRISGPFTVEAVPAPVAKSFDEVESDTATEADISISRIGETLRQDEWRNELLRAGVRAKGGKLIEFTRVEPLSGTRFLQAEAETKEDNPKRVVVCFGPEHAPLEQRMVELALEEARTLKPKPEIILFCAFHFDSEARKDIEETNWPGITLLEAQMNADLLTDDLKKKRSSNESFWLIGQPDVQIKEIKSGDDKGKSTVEVNGFDYYNPKTGTVDSGGKGDIAMWMLDHDYDGRSLFPSQVFFPMAGAKEGWATLAKNLKAEIDEEKIEAFGGTVSLPFTAGKNVAVKIIDARGIESLKIIRL
jgi:adenine-specific DNA-methyltransferase